MLVFDGYGVHIQYSTLKLLGDNNIVGVGLPAHTSHVLQPLDIAVFRDLKESFKKLVGKRSVHSKRSTRNDFLQSAKF